MEINLIRTVVRMIVMSAILLGIYWVVGYLVIPTILSFAGVAAVL